jgi:hypothetical protein
MRQGPPTEVGARAIVRSVRIGGICGQFGLDRVATHARLVVGVASVAVDIDLIRTQRLKIHAAGLTVLQIQRPVLDGAALAVMDVSPGAGRAPEKRYPR